MAQLASILFDMRALDTNSPEIAIDKYLNPSVFNNRLIKLSNLISFRAVGIIIVLAIKLRVFAYGRV